MLPSAVSRSVCSLQRIADVRWRVVRVTLYSTLYCGGIIVSCCYRTPTSSGAVSCLSVVGAEAVVLFGQCVFRTGCAACLSQACYLGIFNEDDRMEVTNETE